MTSQQKFSFSGYVAGAQTMEILTTAHQFQTLRVLVYGLERLSVLDRRLGRRPPTYIPVPALTMLAEFVPAMVAKPYTYVGYGTILMLNGQIQAARLANGEVGKRQLLKIARDLRKHVVQTLLRRLPMDLRTDHRWPALRARLKEDMARYQHREWALDELAVRLQRDAARMDGRLAQYVQRVMQRCYRLAAQAEQAMDRWSRRVYMVVNVSWAQPSIYIREDAQDALKTFKLQFNHPKQAADPDNLSALFKQVQDLQQLFEQAGLPIVAPNRPYQPGWQYAALTVYDPLGLRQ